MQATPTIEPTGSPAFGDARSSPGRRNPASSALARLLSVIRGDKYMVGAYPPRPETAAGTRAGDVGNNHDPEIAVSVRSAVVPEPNPTERAAAVASTPRER
jgi:hypothetical protein